MAQLLSLIATPNAITVYAAKNIKIHSTLFFISIITGMVASLVVFLFFYRVDASLLILGYIIFEISNGFLLGKKLFSNYAKFFLSQKILTVIFGLSFYFAFDVEGVIFGLVLSYVPYIWILVNELRHTRIDFSLLKPRKGFLINNYSINISGAVGGQIDKLIIEPILGFELLGIAVFGIIILPMIIPVLFPKFIDTTIAIQILSVALIPATIGIFYESKLLALEKSKFPAIAKIIGTVFMIFGFLTLGPIYGIIGLSVILVISSCIQVSVVIVATRMIKTEVEKS